MAARYPRRGQLLERGDSSGMSDKDKGGGGKDTGGGPSTSTPAKEDPNPSVDKVSTLGNKQASGKDANSKEGGKKATNQTGSRRNSLSRSASKAAYTATTESLKREQEELDRRLKAASRRQSKVSDYMKKPESDEKEKPDKDDKTKSGKDKRQDHKSSEKEKPEKDDKDRSDKGKKQDYRSNRSAATPREPSTMSDKKDTQQEKEGRIAKVVAAAVSAARTAAEAVAASTAPGTVAAARAAAKLPNTARTIWADEMEKEASSCQVSLSKEDNRKAKEALNKEGETVRPRSASSSRYRTVSSSSSNTGAGTSGRDDDEDDFIRVERRRRGHKPPNRNRGQSYFTSEYKDRLEKERRMAQEERRQAQAPGRTSGSQINLTRQQKDWYRERKCLSCGEDHQLRNCRDSGLTKEKGLALIKAARKEEEETNRLAQRQRSAQTPRSAPTAGTKRSRDSTRTGTTPEAKRGKPSPPMPPERPWVKALQQTDLTLFFKLKNGNPLSEDQFNDLKSKYDRIRIKIGQINMQKKSGETKEFTPRCSGWNWSHDISRVTMKDTTSLNWMQTSLKESYSIQTLEEWKTSQGKLYAGYVTDKFDPSITAGMDFNELAVVIWQCREDLMLEPEELFKLVKAPKVSQGRIIYIRVGEQAERALEAVKYRLEIGSAGNVLFVDNEKFQEHKRERRAQAERLRKANEQAQDPTLTHEFGDMNVRETKEEKEQENKMEEDADKTLTEDGNDSVVIIEKGEKEKGTDKNRHPQTKDLEEEEMDDHEGLQAFLADGDGMEVDKEGPEDYVDSDNPEGEPMTTGSPEVGGKKTS